MFSYLKNAFPLRGRRPGAESVRRAIFEELEPRLLLSADLPLAMPDAPVAETFTPAAVEEVVVSDALLVAQSQAGAETARHEILFIDDSVTDYGQLVADARQNDDPGRELEVVILDGGRDGIEQVSEVLSDRRDIDAVHIVSHGTDQAVRLGGAWLRQDNLDDYADTIGEWGDALAADADLVFYGCNLAASDAGRGLLDAVGDLTGADVAASSDDTGSAALGGDWDLEYRVGPVEAAPVFSAVLQQQWQGLLSLETVSDNFSTGDYAGDTGTLAWTGDWVEVDAGGVGSGSGKVTVIGGELRLAGTAVSADDPSAARQVDLSTATAATLTFDYRTGAGVVSADPDSVVVEISNNGGGTWATLVDFNYFDGVNAGSSSYNIAAYMAVNTQVRFRVNSGYGGASKEFFVDNVQVEYQDNNTVPVADAGGPYAIAEGDGVVLDASASSDIDGDSLSFAWDLDNDGTYGDVTGETASLSWAALQGSGIDDDGSYTIGLQINDGNGGVSTDSASLVVSNTAPTLTVTGAAVVNAGATYTLTLADADPGNDAVSGWVINWGDGSIDTVAGDPSTVTHVYTNAGLTNNVTVSATDEDGVYFNSALLVASASSGADGYVTRYGYDPVTGAADVPGRLELNTTPASTLEWAADVVTGPDGDIYTVGFQSGNVIRFDGASGAFVSVFTTTSSPVSLAFGPDGNLYVASDVGNVKRFDGTSGGFIDTFLSLLYTPEEMTFGPDGNLYVGAYTANKIYRYDGQTGAQLDAGAFIDPTLTATTADNISITEQFEFGPDGNIYVASMLNGKIQRYDGATGAYIDTFASPGSIGSGWPRGPTGVAFGPDGNLYVTKVDRVMRYDGSSGAYIDDFVAAGGGLSNPWFMSFSPAVQVHVNAAPVAIDDAAGVNEGLSVNIDLAGNDSDWDSGLDLASLSIIAGPSNGSLLVNGDGTVDYTHDGGETLGDSFTYSIDDAAGVGSNTATVSISVTPVNDAPLAADKTITILEDTVYTFTLADFGFSDPAEGDSQTFMRIATLPGSGSLSGPGVFAGAFISVANINAGNLTYIPAANVNGNAAASFNFKVLDDGGTANGGIDQSVGVNTITFDITPVNDTPQANGDIIFAWENTPQTAGAPGILANDTDADGSAGLYVYAVNGDPAAIGVPYALPSGALVTIGADGSSRYDANGMFEYLNGGQLGTDIYSYTVKDPSGASATAMITAYIAGANDAPVAVNDGYGVAKDGALTTAAGIDDLLLNDTDVENNTLTVNTTPVTDAGNGVLALNADGTFLYTPTPGFSGADSFTYEISDGKGGTAQATVTLTVNDVPVTAGIADVAVDEDAVNTVIDLFAAFSDTEDADNALAYTLVGNTNSALFSSIAIDGAAGSLTLDYAADQNGTSDLAVRATDTSGLWVESAFTVAVAPVNDGPLIDFPFAVQMVDEDTPLVFSTANGNPLSVSDVDAGDADLSFELWSIKGTVTFSGTSGLAFTSGDGVADTHTTFTASLADVNAALEGLVFNPAAEFSGGANFQLNAWDLGNTGSGGIKSYARAVLITVVPVDDSPIVAGESYSVDEDAVLTTVLGVNDLLDNDSDVEGDALSVNTTPVTDVSDGVLALNANGTFTYTPDANFYGTDSFVYEVSDGNSTTQGTATITVDPLDDMPVAVNDSYTTNEDGGGFLPMPGVLLNDIDVDADGLTAQLVTAPANGTFTLNSNGSYWWFPNPDYNGTDSFTYRVYDGISYSNVATVTLNITPVPDNPYLDLDADNSSGATGSHYKTTFTEDGGAVTIADIDAVLADVDSANIDELYVSLFNPLDGADEFLSVDLTGTSITGSYNSSTGQLFLSGTDSSANYQQVLRSITYNNLSHTPDTTTRGLQLIARNAVFSNVGNVSITMVEVNDVPVATDDFVITLEDSPQMLTTAPGLMGNDTDADGTAGLYVTAVNGSSAAVGNQVVLPSGALLTFNADGTYFYDANGAYDFLSNGSVGADVISYTISDTDGATSTANLTVYLVGENDGPVLEANAGAGTELAGTVVIDDGMLRSSDIDGPEPPLLYTVTSVPGHGALQLDGVVLAVGDTFTQGDIDNNRLAYSHDGTITGGDAFLFTVSDTKGAVLAESRFDISIVIDAGDFPIPSGGDEPVPPPLDDPAPDDYPGPVADEPVEETGQDEGPPIDGAAGDPAAPPTNPADEIVEDVVEFLEDIVETVQEGVVAITELPGQAGEILAAIARQPQIETMQAMWEAIDRVQADISEDAQSAGERARLKVVFASTTGLSLTAGFVTWLLRGGAVLSSLVSTLPLWKGFDPLPVLASRPDEEEDEEEERERDGGEVEDLFERRAAGPGQEGDR